MRETEEEVEGQGGRALATTLPVDSEEAFEAFEAFIRRHVAGGAAAPDTVTGYLREARLFRDRFLLPRGLVIDALTEEDIFAYRRELVEAGLRPTTIGLKLSALRRLLDAAVRTGRLPTNPAAGVRAPRDRRDAGAAAGRVLPLTEAQRLVAAISEAVPAEAVGDVEGKEKSSLALRDRTLIALFLGHGPRTIELHRANLGDLNLGAGELRLRGKARDRTIYLRADVLAVLRELVAVYAATGTLAAEIGASAPLFVNYGRTNPGERLSRRGIRFVLDRAFAAAGLLAPATSRPRKDGCTRVLRRAATGKRAAHDAGVRVPSAHGLRATNITLAREGGAELEHIADDVGHVDLRMTRRYLDRSRRREHNSALRVPLDFHGRGVGQSSAPRPPVGSSPPPGL
jgi:site-specific recombinase XerD